MNFKFLKATFASLVILTSTANAGVIDIDFTALDESGSFNVASSPSTGSLSVIDDVLTLSANAWFYVDLSDAIGIDSLDFDNTTLSFDFMTNGISEIGGLAPTNSGQADWQKTFNLVGTQDNWGNIDIDYTDINEWVTFDINLGDFFSGDFSNIMFANDCDYCTDSNIEVSFKNMSISSPSIAEVPEPTILALFAFAAFGLASRRVKK